MTKTSTKGLFGPLIRLALPIMAGNLMHTLYNLADSWFLGRLGPAELSAPGISFNILYLLIVFGSGFASAGLTLIAQARGEANIGKQEFFMGQLVSFMVIISASLAISASLIAGPILKALQTPEEVYPHAAAYMGIMLAGLPLSLLYAAFQNLMQGIGDSFTPFLIQAATVLINFVLDWILIFGHCGLPALGVAGAAWATVLSQALGVLVGLGLLIRGVRGVKLRLAYLSPNRQAVRLMLSIGTPAAIGQSGSALGFTVLQGVVNGLGTAVIAAFSIGNRITNLFMLPAIGISQATTVMIGQKLGARKKVEALRVLKLASLTVFCFITAGMAFTFFKGSLFVRFFVDDPAVIALGSDLFRVVSLSVILYSLLTVIFGAFQGAGDTRPIMVLNILRLWGLRVPLAWLFVTVCQSGPLGIWVAMVISNLISALIGFFLLARRDWMGKFIQDLEPLAETAKAEANVALHRPVEDSP